jgi:putative sterol carrier protein
MLSSEVRETLDAVQASFLPEKAGNAKGLFGFDLTGEGGGKVLLEVADGQCQVPEAEDLAPDATVTMDAGDFVALFNNQLDPIRAFMGGRIKASGNLGLLMQMLNWFDRG